MIIVRAHPTVHVNAQAGDRIRLHYHSRIVPHHDTSGRNLRDMLHWRKRVPAPDLRSVRRHPSLIEPLPPTADGAFDQALRVEFSWRAERLPPKCDDSDADNDGDD